jgi:hypothetical protein
VDIGVLEEEYSSAWAPKIPTFSIPKKDGTLRVFKDFRKLNLLLKRHPFPIPKIEYRDMICSMEGFTSASAFDLKMGYYHIKLDTCFLMISKDHVLSKIWNFLRPILMIC